MTRDKRTIAGLAICGLLVLCANGFGQGMSPVDAPIEESPVTISGNIGLPGVTLVGLPGNPQTDHNGVYSVEVPYGWAGLVRPLREGFTFQPTSRQYTKMRTDQNNQDYTVTSIRGPGAQAFTASANILVIPTQQVDETTFAETREDMQIMLHILREKLSEPRTILGVLYDFGDFFGPGGRQVEALYLQGYGAVFVMEANFPLTPAAQTDSAEEPETAQPVDPVWQRARQRLYAPPTDPYGGRRLPAQADRASFEQFTEDMVRTLRHAGNIRHLGPDESVILTIVGQTQGPALPFGQMSAGASGGGFVAGGVGGFGGGYSISGKTSTYSQSSSYGHAAVGAGTRRAPDAAATTSTVLTIQAAKTDVDAFAQGDLDFEQFHAKVKVFSY